MRSFQSSLPNHTNHKTQVSRTQDRVNRPTDTLGIVGNGNPSRQTERIVKNVVGPYHGITPLIGISDIFGNGVNILREGTNILTYLTRYNIQDDCK
jgi:hypothetical protein